MGKGRKLGVKKWENEEIVMLLEAIKDNAHLLNLGRMTMKGSAVSNKLIILKAWEDISKQVIEIRNRDYRDASSCQIKWKAVLKIFTVCAVCFLF